MAGDETFERMPLRPMIVPQQLQAPGVVPVPEDPPPDDEAT